MARRINAVSHGVPAGLGELVTLGRTLKKRADDVLAYFDRPGTSNGPTEAINGRLEHLRGSALGFRNLTNHIARSLLESAGQAAATPWTVKSHKTALLRLMPVRELSVAEQRYQAALAVGQ